MLSDQFRGAGQSLPSTGPDQMLKYARAGDVPLGFLIYRGLQRPKAIKVTLHDQPANVGCRKALGAPARVFNDVVTAQRTFETKTDPLGQPTG